MSADLLLLISFCVWVLWRAWAGYRSGAWLAALGVLALIVAYGAVLLFGRDVASVLSANGVSAQMSTLIAYPFLFISCNFLVQYLPFVLMPVLKQKTRIQAFIGAGIGGVVGCVTGLIAVWFLGFVGTALSAKDPGRAPARLADERPMVSAESSEISAFREGVEKESLLEKAASNLVSKTVEIGAAAAGVDREQAVVMSEILRQPDVVMGGMQEVMKSEEMRHILHSEHTRRMMAINDVSSLQNSSAFHELMTMPAMDNMMQSLQADGKNAEDSERFIAEQLTSIWRRFEYLKHDERVKTLLKDDELQDALKGDNPAMLMANVKFQKLIALVMNGSSDISNSQVNELLLSSLSNVEVDPNGEQMTGLDGQNMESDTSASYTPKPYTPKVVYKWRNDDGRIEYSDWEDIPEHLRESAKKLKR